MVYLKIMLPYEVEKGIQLQRSLVKIMLHKLNQWKNLKQNKIPVM